MTLVIEDGDVTSLVERLATRRGVSPSQAVKLAVEAELGRDPQTLRERLEAFWRENPSPPPTGLLADKAFFDDLSGES